MVFLTRKERVRAAVYLRLIWEGAVAGRLGWSYARRFAFAAYSTEVFAPLLFVLVLFGVPAGLIDWRPSMAVAGLVLGTCVLCWHGVMLYLHRYVAHRSFVIRKRWLESGLSVLAALSMQGYPLTWAFYHRKHHQTADTEDDPHSPEHASVIWLFSLFKSGFTHFISEKEYASYLAAFPAQLRGVSHADYLRRVERRAVHVALLQSVWFLFLFAAWGLEGMVYLGMLPVLAVHVEVCLFINVLSHRYGYRNFDLGRDHATNHFAAGLTISEWQNNHHRYPACANNRVKPWEVDVLYQILRVWKRLGWVGQIVMRGDPASARMQAEEAEA